MLPLKLEFLFFQEIHRLYFYPRLKQSPLKQHEYRLLDLIKNTINKLFEIQSIDQILFTIQMSCTIRDLMFYIRYVYAQIDLSVVNYKKDHSFRLCLQMLSLQPDEPLLAASQHLLSF